MNFLFLQLISEPLNKEANMMSGGFNAAKTLLGKAFTGTKNLAKQEWNSMGRFGKAMTLAPAAMQVPGLADKYDEQGRSRAERMTSIGGNIVGGLAGASLGSNLGNKLNTATSSMGRVGKGIGSTGKLVGSIAGGMGGTILGERAAGAPFKMLQTKPQQPNYALTPTQNPPQETPATNQNYFQQPNR